MTKEIEVVPYNPHWPELFENEADQIQNALGGNCLAVHHVGSTSVPGLAAKPKIDIIAVVRNPEEASEPLESIGFDYRGEYNIPMHYGFSKRGKVSVNLHVYQEEHPEIELNLTFRDYLRSHPKIRDEYAEVKSKLLEDKLSHEKNDAMFTGYNLGKDAFIGKVLKLAGFQALRFVICTHFKEWEAAKQLRQLYFFDKVPIKDPYEWTFTHADHVHFILYKGIEIVGYAHVQLWPGSRAAIRIIVVEESSRNLGFGKQFLMCIEAWLRGKGYQSLHAEASPDSLPFYVHLGYIEMPFEDPDGYESDSRDTPVGKLLK